MVGSMIEPQLFDVIELLVDLPESNLRLGARGAIVDCYSDGNYEVEFSDRDGETIALCTLSSNQFVTIIEWGVIAFAKWINPEANLAIALLKLCFFVLDQLQQN